jgi:hypothetical protein
VLARVAGEGEGFEDFLLEGMWREVEDGERRVADAVEVLAFLADGVAEALGFEQDRRVRRRGFPSSRKLGGTAAEQVGEFAGGTFDGPFKTAGHGGVGEVGRADVGGGEPGFAVEKVGLGVEAGGVGVVVDADLGVRQSGEFFDDGGVGVPHVAGGDEAQVAAARGEGAQGFAQQAHAAGFHEGDEHVAAVGGGEFQFDLASELRQAWCAGEQRGGGKLGERAGRGF